jgi:glycosyltransferase involved in cell wall biosynthesis
MNITAARKGDHDKSRSVLIVVENLSVPFDRRVWKECQALRAAGYRVATISPMGVGVDTAWHEVIDDVSVYRYRAYQASGSFASYLTEFSVALVMTFLLMWVVLVRNGFKVIQICNPPDLLILPTLPFKLLGKKVIFDQHDLCPEIYETQRGLTGEPNRVVRALLWFERLTYACSDVVLVVNESCRRVALRRGRRREADVFVVRNGPSAKSIAAATPNVALKRGRRHLLGYVGMMGPQDGIDVLLRAVRALAVVHRRTDFCVLIMGSGTVLERMKEYASELDVADFVTFTGTIAHAAVLEGIASTDLCLCPDPKTPLSDKCSLVKAIEYMSLGRPFVAFDLEEVRLSAGDAAVYAKPRDEADFAAQIDSLLDDATRRETMGKIGRDRVLQSLTWEHSTTALYAAYDAALGRSRPALGIQPD